MKDESNYGAWQEYRFSFFFMNGNTEQAQCALSRVCIPQEKEKKGNEKDKTNLLNI